MTQLGWFHTSITDLTRRLVSEALSKNYVTSGPHTRTLEKELATILGVPTCLYTNSGTSALSIALFASGVKSDSLVATSGIGWVATPQAIQLTGAKPHIFDVLEDLPILDCSKIIQKYDVLLPVNYNGRHPNLSPYIDKYPNTVVIEDSCKSLFSTSPITNRPSGTSGSFGCYSLGMISALPGAYGGIVVSNRPDDYDKLSVIKWHGVRYVDGIEQYHSRSYNFKSSNLHAAFALGMLDSYQERLARLRSIYQMYLVGLNGLENVRLLPSDLSAGEVPLLIDLFTPFRSKYIAALNASGIPTCNYHNSLSHLPDVHAPHLVNSELFANGVFHPPCGPDQDLSTIEQAISIIRSLG
ncbi:DegT/DnrJ/EryC1/StrS family aminotransferase [Cyanobium sp. WAJ14-Wanaka]|uniref:DegT/DnrJ/EryC1/StrS family aminotransferase n=1 Tax=Cyanobium sp. WAJ14-Wanaka TaxID=2823725 RepID=UPI0020CDDAFE|nr:DegT/DnrJ/EryC1/StrS aminotransferase family protein [Cyanobium sp. WAJ14-Wanaka]MCP9775674.1 DegT/DnrJ/EryC1/StrS aminotransferase family protein [Cyanobium sp. WAJ14-Wanaka]